MATTTSPERLAELRTMPYEEYLQTPEWQATRKRILKRDHHQCQGCHAIDVLLHVHHYTYARLGQEQDADLVTLCEVCHEELHRSMKDPPKLSFLQRCGVGLSTAALGTIGMEGFLHAPLPAEIGVLVGAFLLAKNSPAIYARLKEMVPPEVLAWGGLAPEKRQAGKPSFLDIWLGRDPRPVQEAPQEHGDEDEVSDSRVAAYLQRSGIAPAKIAELLAEVQDTQSDEAEEEEDDDTTVSFEGYDHRNENEMKLLTFGKRVTLFSELLKTGWRPSINQIYLGTDRNGDHVFVPAKKLCHVALAGTTGNGKTSLLRLIMAQLCYLRLPVALLNPHYMIWDADHEEDWTPYTPYLHKDPLDCAEMTNIEKALRWMYEVLLPKRKERTRRGESAGLPFFFILDEYPDIVAEIDTASNYVGKLLRQGRKYGIFLIVASQNYDVKTMAVEGEGGVRKCFRTVCYVGGDPVSVKELLGMRVSDIPENDLGQGTIMLKCAGIKKPIVVYVPYLDNKSLYMLLGPTTFVKPVQEVQTDELENGEDAMAADLNEKRNEAVDKPTVKPNLPDARLKSEDLHIDTLIQAWNAGINTVSKIEKFFVMSHGEAYKAYKRVKAQRGEPIEEQE